MQINNKDFHNIFINNILPNTNPTTRHLSIH